MLALLRLERQGRHHEIVAHRTHLQALSALLLWIAASALEHGAALLTRDEHFGQIEGLRCGRQLEDFLP